MKYLLIPFLLFYLSSSYADTVEERVEDLEMSRDLDILSFKSVFKYHYDSIKRTTKSTGSETEDKFHPHRVYYSLDSSANVTKNIRFFGRIAASKFINTLSLTDADLYLFGKSRGESGDGLYLERAFVEYDVADNVTLSAGRLPTIDGPPINELDGLARQGTYPILGYGNQLDGLAATYSASFMPRDNSLVFRLVYTPLYNMAKSITGLTNPKMSIANTASNQKEHSHLSSAILEYSNSNRKFWDQFLFIYQLVDVGEAQVRDVYPAGTDLGTITASPASGGNGIPSATGLTAGGSNLVLSSMSHTLFAGFRNIAQSGINFSFTYLSSKMKSKGLFETGAVFGPTTGLNKGYMTNRSSETVTGKAWLATMSYKLRWKKLRNPTIGMEYFDGNKHHLYVGDNNDDLTGLYGTRGNFYHIYWSQPLGSGLRFRIGYSMQDHDYTKGFIGEPTASDVEEENVYAMVRLDI
ncbi:DUF3373 domain-containing protein [Bacteriovoracaceae bacterium]|nr:DUF3373 domain-containing protein [Bacteriovoracaceae bacterium]